MFEKEGSGDDGENRHKELTAEAKLRVIEGNSGWLWDGKKRQWFN